MTPILYYMEISPPCRAVAMTARALGYDLEKIPINLFAKEHTEKTFEKMNPDRLIPVIIEDGYTLCESRAIMKYLVRKCGKSNDSLYPSDDIKAMHQIDRFLDFDLFKLFGRFQRIIRPVFVKQRQTFDPQSQQKLAETLDCMEKFLEGKKFITGDHHTLADISMVATTSQLFLVEVNLSNYPNVSAWFERCKTTIPYYQEENAIPLESAVKQMIVVFPQFKK